MKVLVVGATGVLGRNVVPRLLERGHDVRTVIRRPERAHFSQLLGAEPVAGDIFDLESLSSAARGCDVALHLATAIPKSPEQDWSVNDRIRREGTQNVLAASARTGLKRYIQQSIAFLYGDCGRIIVDESAPLQPAPIIQSAADMEEMVRASSLEWCILRGGSFYGKGTGQEERWREDARQGRLMLPGDGSDLISLVHVVDMARAVVMAAESASPGSIHNVVDDEPVSYKSLYTYIAAQIDAPAPQPGGRKAPRSLGCSNAKIKRDLSWQPVYPSYRSGLAE